jgi:rRNA maturation endonuclease Nob1
MIKGKTKLAPGIFEEFNYKCTNCGMMYGKQPSYCHSCGCNKLNKV